HLRGEDGGIGVDQPMDAILLNEFVPVVEIGALDARYVELLQHGVAPPRVYRRNPAAVRMSAIMHPPRKNRNTRSAPTPSARLLPPARTGFLEPLRKPARLVALELEEIVDEHVPELGAKQRFALERLQRGGQARGQHGPTGVVGVVLGRSGIERVLDAVEAGDDVR